MRTNRFLAVLLAATMVFGSTVTAFAADDPTEAATGTGKEVEGQGAAEGYVNTSVTKVVLPTTTATTFAFIMDPQEMLKTTNGARLGTAWKQPTNDTFVYFKTANGYENKSDTVYFINKSTVTDLDVSVKAVVTDASSKPITLDEKANATHTVAALASDATPKLYLGLNVGKKLSNLTNSSTGTTIKVTAAKSPNEYTIVYKNKAYTYAEKAGSTFQAVPIYVEGSVSHKETDVQAPKLTLTWSWAPKGTGQTEGATSVKYVTTDAYTISGGTLDQTAAAYGSFNGKIGPGYGGMLTMTGTTATITVPSDYVIEKVEFAADGSDFKADTNVTFKNKVVTIKGALWNADTTEAGAKVKVTFADPDEDDDDVDAPDPFIFEKP